MDRDLKLEFFKAKQIQNLGASCGGGPPVPIPNTEVKPISADDSRKAKVGRRPDFVSVFCYKKSPR